jgi:hypothetical protein
MTAFTTNIPIIIEISGVAVNEAIIVNTPAIIILCMELNFKIPVRIPNRIKIFYSKKI